MPGRCPAPTPRRVLLTGLLLLGSAGWPGSWGRAQVGGDGPAALASEKEARPGDFLSLLVPAPGVAAGDYALGATLPEGWTVLAERVTQPETGRPLLLNLYVPEGAGAGVQELTFTLSGPGGPTQALGARVRVPARPAFTLDFPTSARVQPAERRRFQATLRNTGNAPDTFELSVEGSATLTPARLRLGPGESGQVEVAYAQANQGNADHLTLRARSAAAPEVRQEAHLNLSVGRSAGTGGPELSWQISLAPQASYQTPPGPTTPAPVPTAPGGDGGSAFPQNPDPSSPLPSSPLPADATAGSAPGSWLLGGAVGVTLSGALSDYATGSAAYTVTRTETGALRDTGEARVQWGSTSVAASSSAGLDSVGLAVNTTRGDYTFGVNASRQAATSPDGSAVYTVGAGVRHASGISLNAAQQFGGAHTSAVGVGWRRQLGAFSPAVSVYGVRRDDGWGVVLSQQLGYENRLLIAREDYSYDSLLKAHTLNVRVNSRQVTPFGIGAAAQLSVVDGVAVYGASAQLSYTPDDSFGVRLRASAGTDGPSAQLGATKVWQLGATGLTLDGQLGYAQGSPTAGLQATATLPAGDAQVQLRGGVAYGGGSLGYGAGAAYSRGPLRATAGVQRQGNTTQVSASAAYRPPRGVQGSVDLQLSSSAAATTWQAQGSAGYATDSWNAALTGGYRSGNAAGGGAGGAPGGAAGGLFYGATVGARVLDALALNASVQRSAPQSGAATTRLRLGASFTPGGALKTPDAVVKLFGGRNAGTARVLAFLDTNRNGVQDGNETVLAVPVRLGDSSCTTDAQGQGEIELRPGDYSVQLGDAAPAYLQLAQLPPVKVGLRQTVTVRLAVQQVGILQGQLLDDSAQPLAGVPVTVSPEGPPLAGAGAAGEPQTILTDAEGRYRLTGLNFGRYRLAAALDPALYVLPAPEPVELSAAQSLVTHELSARAIVDERGLDASGLEVSLSLPETPVPPGVRVPLRVQASPGVERLTLDGPETLLIREAGTDTWLGEIQVPADQTTPLEVAVTAWQGSQSAGGRAILLVDPALKAHALSLRPQNALPDQVLELQAQVYGAAGRVTLRDESGRTLLLTAGGAQQYFGDVRASTVPGRHTLTLMVDGQPTAEVAYTVLGRP